MIDGFLERLWWRAPVVPLVRLAGPVGEIGLRRGLTLARVEPLLEAAFAIRRAPAVALAVDCPGGSAVQSALIAARIRKLAESKKKPVLVFVEDVAASGGYWLASAGDEIFCDPSSILGSIGVISAGFGLVEAIGRLGVERRLHATGPQKGLLDPFQPEREPDLEVLREIQAGILDEFLAQIRARRGERLKIAPAELTSGRVWTGRRAVELGLADGLGQAHAVLRERFGENLRIRRIESRRSFWRARLGLDGADVVGEVATGLDDRAARHRLGAGA